MVSKLKTGKLRLCHSERIRALFAHMIGMDIYIYIYIYIDVIFFVTTSTSHIGVTM